MKKIDKFLKYLKTDRNTFCTYILTLITIYLVVDRFVELLLIIFSGISVSYWGPIQYTLALACPVAAFYLAYASKFCKSLKLKLNFFYIYCIALYIIIVTMLVQWINMVGWSCILLAPNYISLITNFPDLIRPAFTSIALYLPLVTFYPLFKFLYAKVQDTKDLRDSIDDYGGIDLSNSKEGTGPYTCEVAFCKVKETGKMLYIPENRRFEATLICGVSGTGKTTMVFEPMVARDIEKKFFFKETAKEMGYTALKTGLATLNCPYDNDYINDNFNLTMLTPNSTKLKIYNAYLEKLIYNFSEDNIIYKDLGITYIAPDYESTKRIKNVAKNFNMKVNLIDPNDMESAGLNPFVHKDPIKTAIIISSVLKGMYSTSHTDVEEAFRENTTIQALENISLLLKEMYPRLHSGLLPNLEDILKMLNNFDLVEEMCEELKKDEFLSEQYSLQLGYFEKNFYKNSKNREDTEKFVHSAITQLDNLLRFPGVKNILCKRSNNINFEEVLKNGEINLVCTRRGDLGETAHKAFGLFFLLLMQHSVLSRPGNEKTRIPHFLYVDEFADFVCKATEPMFTLYRKYRVGVIISVQNLTQLQGGKLDSGFKQTISANCTHKMVFGNNSPADNAWWQTELGTKREWKNKFDFSADKGQYSANLKDMEYAWKDNYKAGKIQSLKFKNCIFKTKNVKGKNVIDVGLVDFLDSKYKEKQEVKTYKFSKFTNGIYDENHKTTSTKIDYKTASFEEITKMNDYQDTEEDNPISTDITDSRYLFDNEDAVAIDLSQKPKKNKKE